MDEAFFVWAYEQEQLQEAPVTARGSGDKQSADTAHTL